MLDRDHLARSFADALGDGADLDEVTPVGGGDIHRALRVRRQGQDWFVKWNRADALPLLETERRGLEALAAPGCIALPRPLITGADDDHAWLAMTWLELRGAGDAEALGRNLADLHRVTGASHGWEEDNFIGHTPQANGTDRNWARFWWRRRLAPQLERAVANGHGGRLASRIGALEACSRSLLDHDPPASLLHGDLWGGNHGYLPDGRPVLFDPAPWRGDRETDLAMMRLFGGFDPAVLRAYEAAWPLPRGAGDRLPLYQLYHVLNHLNLFGAGWLGRVESLLDRLL